VAKLKWQEKYKDKLVFSAREAVKHVESGDLVVCQQAHGETRNFVKAIVDRHAELRDVRMLFHIQWGLADYAKPEMGNSFKAISQFVADNVREFSKQGRVDFLPAFYYQMPLLYRTDWKPDVFLLMVTPPDEQGRCSFGLSADYSVACAEQAKKVIVQVNPSLPFTYGSYFSLDRATCIYEQDEAIPERFMGGNGEIEQMIAEHIAPLIPDGATLQLGIGAVPDAVLARLKDKHDIGIHSELFSDGVVDLYNEGIITNKRKTHHRGKFVANFLIGSKKLFDFVDHNPDVLMLPVDITNDPVEIAKNDYLISINSCLQVDLFGQIAADTLHGAQYSGVGGQVDFVRGAQMSRGGKSIITVKSTAKNGTLSCIVCRLPEDALVTTSRYDVQYVCSEYGIVNLFGMTVSERAKALISIAHPKFRKQLEYEAREAKIIIK
jgi:4-hydroxybutyrate CoA-transferase